MYGAIDELVRRVRKLRPGELCEGGEHRVPDLVGNSTIDPRRIQGADGVRSLEDRFQVGRLHARHCT